MVDAKKSHKSKKIEWLIFLYLAIFPLGQIIRLSVGLFGVRVPVHPVDVIVLLFIPLFIFIRPNKPKYFKYIKNFLIVALFSLLLSTAYIRAADIVIGSFYFLRLVSYILFFVGIYGYLKTNKNRKILFKSLILVVLFVGILGWVQYFFYPDLRYLKFLGWDDHLYRLAGTFLDPAFTSIILVLGFIASFSLFLKNKNKKYFLISLFLFVSVAFTYARAAYIALIAGTVAIFYLRNKSRKILFAMLAFLFLIILFLPRPSSEGVKLERTYSIVAKVVNYQETINIVKEYPLFGVGFNNICFIRKEIYKDIGYSSHSCAGSDSSLLFLFATTGILGFMTFVYAGIETINGLKNTFYKDVLLATLVSLLVHSLFVHSLFYPWVMGYMAVLTAASAVD